MREVKAGEFTVRLDVSRQVLRLDVPEDREYGREEGARGRGHNGARVVSVGKSKFARVKRPKDERERAGRRSVLFGTAYHAVCGAFSRNPLSPLSG